MPRKKKTNGDNPIGIGYTSKQMKRKKPISNSYLIDIEPITDNQKKLFESYSAGKHLVDNVESFIFTNGGLDKVMTKSSRSREH